MGKQCEAPALPTQLPANTPRKAAEGGPYVWAPATPKGDQDTDSWLSPGPAPAI